MAIWNYRAELVPRRWIINEYGEIPLVLDREETMEEALARDPHVAEQKELSRWANLDFPADFIAQAEAILFVTERTSTYVCCGFRGSHRIEFWLEDGRPDLIGIKLDLRQPDIDIFKRVVDYAAYLDTLVVPDDRHSMVAPTIEDLIADLRLSRAYRFCTDPSAYLAGIAPQSSRD